TLNDTARTFTYDPNGNVTQMVANSGSGQAVRATLGYDGANRLSDLTDVVGAGSSQIHHDQYTYDASGNRNAITTDGVASTLSYDGENQLTSVAVTGGSTTSYSYSAEHNRLSTVVTGGVGAGTTSYSYDTAGVLLTQKSDPNGKHTDYTYDQSG